MQESRTQLLKRYFEIIEKQDDSSTVFVNEALTSNWKELTNYYTFLINMHLKKEREKDSKLFASYVQTIKGNKSASEFAEILDVNPSTVSRLLSENYKSTVTETLVKKLACLITPEMDIPVDKFFAANGMRIEDPKELMRARIEYRSRLEDEAESIILRGISSRGKGYSKLPGNTRINLVGDMTLIPDMVLDVEGVRDEDLPHNSNWMLDFMLGDKTDVRHSSQPYRRLKASVHQRISTLVMQMLQYDKDTYEEDYEFHEVPVKYSLVFSDKASYDTVVECFNNIKCPIAISFILIDLKEKTVIKEVPLKSMNGYRHEVFFSDNYYVDDEENLISKKEYYDLLEQMVDEYIEKGED